MVLRIEHLSRDQIAAIANGTDLEVRIKAFQDLAPFPERQISRASKRAWLAERLPRGTVGAEIGVFRGHFAEVLCSVARPRLLFLVDPWTLSGPTFRWGAATTCNGLLSTKDAYEEAKFRAVRGGARELIIVEGFFPECSSAFSVALDWVYLDASHSYECTRAELDALDRIMAPGGIICGDDWRPRPDDRHHGVFLAVQDFVRRSDWRIVMCGYLGQWMLKRI